MNIREMKQKALNIARITLAIVVVASFIWLHWWVLPDLAFVTLAPKGSSIPVTGYTFDGYKNGKYDGSRIVDKFAIGWPGVLAGWPYVLIGILGGLSVGYIVGEFTRRKLAVEELTKEKEAEWKEIFNGLEEREGKIIQMLALAVDWIKVIDEAKKKSDREGEQTRADAKIQQQSTANEEKLKKELLNARDKIKRLEAKK